MIDRPRRARAARRLTALIDVIHAHLDAIAAFVDIYAELDPDDVSPGDRGRLVEVECLVNQALDRFSSAE